MPSSDMFKQSIVLAGSIAITFMAAVTIAHAHQQQSDEVGVIDNSSTPTIQEEAQSPDPPTLWQDLKVGMTPEQAAPFIRQISGVSKAIVNRRRTNENPSQMRISYRSDKIQIAGMPFEIKPRFKSRRLSEVWLTSTDQCSNDAVVVLDQLSAGLATKYPGVIFEEQFSEVELARANRESRSSGQSVRFSRIYSSREIAVVLTFSFSSKSVPPYPGSGNRFALSLYQIARSNYRQRTQECNGTGNNRMDVALQYMTRSAFDSRAAAFAKEIQEEHTELVDQL